jgi:hypothetical protein
MYIGTRRQFYRSSYVMSHKISDGVEERAKRENDVVASRTNHLMSETTTLWDNFTTIAWVVATQLIIFLFYMHKLRDFIALPNDL